MGGEHATETAEESGLTSGDTFRIDSALQQASPTNLLTAARQKLQREMESTPCHQTETVIYAVKTALQVLDARDKDRVEAEKG